METAIKLGGEKPISSPVPWKRSLIRSGLILSGLLWAADIIYRAAGDISYLNRQKCVLFRILPRPGFLAYEYLFETIAIVFVGTFIAVLLARQSGKLSRFLPKHPAAAFLYGSVVPVCSCAAIPLLSCMKGRMRFPTTMAFVLAAPLLSPQIIILSFGMLGFKYGVLRILSSFVLVMLTVTILGSFERRRGGIDMNHMVSGCTKTCRPPDGDIYLQTFAIFKSLLPFLMVAGAMGMLLEYFSTRDLMLHGMFGGGLGGIMTWILVGVPLYFCNGAEVLFLRPLMSHGFPIGTGIAFSLTSTAICTTSIAMLFRLIGARLTFIFVGSIISIAVALALLMNHM